MPSRTTTSARTCRHVLRWLVPLAMAAVAARPALASYGFYVGKPDLAGEYLTFYSNTKAMDGLRLGQDLVAGIDARTRVQFGIREPEGERINSAGGETVNCLVGHDPDQPSQ